MIPFNSAPEEWSEQTWRELFENVVSYTAMLHENSKDIVAGGWALGERRANLLGRDFWPGEDVVHPLCIFCWWPFKPALSADARNFIRDTRWSLFQNVSISPKAMQDLHAAVPNELLFIETQQLFTRLRLEPAWEVIRLHQPAR